MSSENKHKSVLDGFSSRLSQLIPSEEKVHFAESIGVKYETVRKWCNGKNLPNGKQLVAIADKLKVSTDWLLFGKATPQAPDPSFTEFTLIPKYKTKLSGGTGTFSESDRIEARYAFRKEWISKIGPSSSLVLFEVSGDSMLPIIEDGDVVMVDISKNSHEDIKEGKIYAIRERNLVKVKKLQWQAGNLWVISNNQNAARDYKADVNNFHLIGKVIWVGHEVR